MTVYQIPLSPKPQALSVNFPNGNVYNLRFLYQFSNPGSPECWILDISDAQNNPLVCGIPLITGADLLAQYKYLDFGCTMYCTVDGDISAVPAWYNLGGAAHLWLEG